MHECIKYIIVSTPLIQKKTFFPNAEHKNKFIVYLMESFVLVIICSHRSYFFGGVSCQCSRTQDEKPNLIYLTGEEIEKPSQRVALVDILM